MEVLRIDSVRQLRDMEGAWDGLWARSAALSPMLRARLLANWIDHFQNGSPFLILAVKEGERLLAALPLLQGRLKGLVSAGMLPVNQWTSSGDLLLDQQVESQPVLQALLSQADRLPWSMLSLDEVETNANRWSDFRSIAGQSDCKVVVTPKWKVGRVTIGDDMDTYLAALQPDHRRNVLSKERKLDRAGRVQLQVHRPQDDHECERLVLDGFEIEDRSWKGSEQTSVIRTPGALNYYTELARDASSLGHLELLFLTLDDQPMAFAFNLFAKGCHFGLKMGYDPDFRAFAPGIQIVSRNLRRLHADPTATLFDFYGPVSKWSARFSTHTCQVGRLLVALPGTGSKLALATYAPLRSMFGGAEEG